MRLSAQSKTVSSCLSKPRASCPRVRQQRRYNSSTPESNPKNTNQPSQSHNNAPSTSPPPTSSHATPSTPPPGSVASSAGGSAAPVPARSLREVIQAGPVGRLGRSYSRVQQRRPYTTQLCSSVVVYLCGDLSAQMLFPTERPAQRQSETEPSTEKKGDEADDGGGGGGGSLYDPWRTMRHLTVGVGSSIPSYNWYVDCHDSDTRG